MNNDIKFLNIDWRTRYSSQILKTISIAWLSYIFRLQYVRFPSHFFIGVILKPSGQLAELFVYIIPLK